MSFGFVGLDGYPCSFEESPIGLDLIDAIRRLPGSDSIPDYQLESFALRLFIAHEQGRAEEQPNAQPATETQTRNEMLHLVHLADRLKRHIEGMRKPSHESFASYGVELAKLSDQLPTIGDVVGAAFGESTTVQTTRGRPAKQRAKRVTDEAAKVYQSVTLKAPKKTRDALTNEISGDWPRFLETLLRTFHIEASVEAQVNAWEKNRAKIPE